MAQIVVSRADRFPVGTTVYAYPVSNWPHHKRPPSGAPEGASAGNAVVAANGSVTITGLADETNYYLYASVSSEHRYVAASTKAISPSAGSAASVGFTPAGTVAASNVQAAIEEVAAEAASAGVPSSAVDQGQAGEWVNPFPFGSITTHATPANQWMPVRHVAKKTRTVLGIDYEVHALVAGGDVYAGLFAADGTLLKISAEQADQAASNGQKRAAFSGGGYEIVAGTEYYVALACSGVATLRGISIASQLVGRRWGATLGLVDIFGDNRASWAAVPSGPLAVDDTTLTSFPLMSLYES